MSELVIKSIGAPKKIIFIFHGYGADKENMKPIGQALAQSFEDIEIRMPDGFQECNEGIGYQWFPFGDEDNEESWYREYLKIEPIMTKYVDETAAKHGLTRSDVILAGFSQGAMLALTLGLRISACAAISFAGTLLGREIPSDSPTKILIAHGEIDNVMPIHYARESYEFLLSKKVDAKMVTSPMLAHATDSYLINETVDFLKSLNI